MTLRKVAIIQARMASSRLPGKVLMDIEGRPMLQRVVDRTRLARTADTVIVATTTEASDDAVAEYCKGAAIRVVRGSHFDVLDRYYQAASHARAEIVIRITADCPLIDPGLVDDAVRVLISGRKDGAEIEHPSVEYDLVANRLPPPWKRTYPIGLDTEVCTFEALQQAWRVSRDAVDREHVMPFLYRGLAVEPTRADVVTGTSGNGFRVAILQHDQDLGDWRWTVDTAEDLNFVRAVYRALRGRTDFSWLDVVGLIRESPDLAAINAEVKHKSLTDIDERSGGLES